MNMEEGDTNIQCIEQVLNQYVLNVKEWMIMLEEDSELPCICMTNGL